MRDEDEPKPTPAAVTALWQARRAGLRGGDDALPPEDADLAPLTRARVPAADPGAPPEARAGRGGHARKQAEIAAAFAGRSEAAALNALLIAHLRKRAAPDRAARLFQRLWAEHGAHLLGELDPRWRVSSLATFGDHGLTVHQRTAGLGLAVLFNTMKLYEWERLYGGQTGHKAHAIGRHAPGPLPLAMAPYSLDHGGLDVNLLARLWDEAARDPVIAPLAHGLLAELMDEERGLFHRLRIMRMRKARADRKAGISTADPETPARPTPPPRARLLGTDRIVAPVAHRTDTGGTPRWGIVATIAAPLPAIARFAAHHLSLGARAVHLFLDTPDAAAAAFLARDRRVHIVQCDTEYWQATGKPRMADALARQAFNATGALAAVADDLDWLAHLAVDEMLMPHRPVAETLALAPPDAAWLRLAPLEALAPGAGPPRHFKRTPADAGQPDAVLHDIYPAFGAQLPGGFLGPVAGRVLARTGIPDCRLDPHRLRHAGRDVANMAEAHGLPLARLNAASRAAFDAHRVTRPGLGTPDALFAEACADTPALRARLAARGMLVGRDLDLDGTVARIFGALP